MAMGVYRSDVGGTEQALLGLTDAIYDAATGPGSWSAVGDDLLELFGARSSSIMVGTLAAGDARVLYHGNLPLDAVAAYRDHYRTVDLWTNRAAQAIARAGHQRLAACAEFCGRGHRKLQSASAPVATRRRLRYGAGEPAVPETSHDP
jgi:hypothetical protein